MAVRSDLPAANIVTLKRRSDFLRVRKGRRWATAAFVLEAKRRDGSERALPEGTARFGFTVTKQVGGAVERNRIRRRLKAAVRNVQKDHAKPDFDYVLIARQPALDVEFNTLVADLLTALARTHAQASRPGRRQAQR
jgi:ribonuclease P protein component